MFDVGFWEMAFIGVIALVVIGPERLPGVARNVGMWVGKGRRMINDVKKDIKNEMNEEDLKNLRELKQDLAAASDVSGIKEVGTELKNSIDDVSSSISKETGDINKSVSSSKKTTKSKTTKKKATKKTAPKKAVSKKKATSKKSVSKKSAAKTAPKKASSKSGPAKKTMAKKKPSTATRSASKSDSDQAATKATEMKDTGNA